MKKKLPIWVWLVAILGILWNFFGVVQIILILTGNHSGVTAEQAVYFATRPVWISVFFIISSVGGVVGNFLLLFRLKQATIIFIKSLIAYIVFSIGDISQDVLVVFGKNYSFTLFAVVFVAALFLLLSLYLQKTGRYK